MTHEEDRQRASLVPAVRGEIVSRSTALVRRGLDLLDAPHGSEATTTTDLAHYVDDLRKRAERGDAEAQCTLGFVYEHGLVGVLPQDYVGAVAWYRKAADQGDPEAQFFLGKSYYFGQGVVRDETQAIAWYRKAADQDQVGAQYSLGLMCADGQGVKDDREAEALWRKAAEQGHPQAQYCLGLMYARAYSMLGGFYFAEEVVPRDYAEAHKWFNLAASRATGEDQKTFAEARDALLEAMTPVQIAEAQERASEWLAAFENRQK